MVGFGESLCVSFQRCLSALPRGHIVWLRCFVQATALAAYRPRVFDPTAAPAAPTGGPASAPVLPSLPTAPRADGRPADAFRRTCALTASLYHELELVM